MTLFPQCLRNFLGWQYPERQLMVSLSLPLVKAAAAPVLNDLHQLQKKRENDEQDAEFLRLLLQKLRQLNRCRLRVAAREEFNHTLAALFYPLAQAKLAQYGKDGGVPDSQTRAQVLETQIAGCAEFVNSYIVITQYYQRCSRFRYARSIKKSDLASARVLEFLKLKQSLKALRYQELSPRAWAFANTLMHQIVAAGRQDELLSPLQRSYGSDTELETIRVRDVYLSLHMVQRLQLSYWPVQWQTWLQRSIGLGDLKIALGNAASGAPSRHTSLVYCGDEQPTRFVAVPGQAGPAPLVLQWESLQQALTSDLAQVLRTRRGQEAATLSRHLSLFGPTERLALAQLQFERFQAYPVSAELKLDQQREVPDLRIFIGFQNVFALLRHIAKGGDWKAVGERMVDLLARHSAVFSDDAEGSVQSSWTLRHQDEQHLCLSTQESRHTTQMQIGDLAAFMLEQADWHAPKLGVIQRILRLQNGQLLITIKLLCENSQAVLIDNQAGQSSAISHHNTDQRSALMPAILGGREELTQLLLPTGVRTREEGMLLLQTRQTQETVQLGHMISASKGFTLHALRRQPQAVPAVHQANRAPAIHTAQGLSLSETETGLLP